jgi:serine/threonine-protein kinase
LQPGQRPLPEYELVQLLGRGGFGEVWKAKGPGGFAVALKFIRLDATVGAVEQRAMQLVEEVRHIKLLGQFGSWQRDNFLIIAMELAEGTLQDRLQEAVQQGLPGIPRDELLEYLREAAKGLDYLHAQGLQHRDIKPANFLLVGGGVKLADFGLAKLLERTQATASGAMTPAYAAPELFNHQVSRWTDQYALAVSYFQLRTNRLVYEGTPVNMMAGHLLQAPDLSRLPEGERPVVARALAKKPEERWPSCRAFVEALAAGMAEHQATPLPAVRARPAAPATTPTYEPAPERPAKPRPPERTAHQRAGTPKPRRTPRRERGGHVSRRWPALPWAVLAALGVLVVFGIGLALLVRSGGKSRDTSRAEPLAPPQQPKVAELNPPAARAEPPSVAVAAAAPDREITNSIGMKLVRIPAGTFLMGSPEYDTDATDDEKPRHEVKITQDFYLGKYEVTRGQFRRFVEAAGYRTEAEQPNEGGTWKINQFYSQTDEHPVVYVSWNDAREFCNWLTKKEGRKYRLPTEAEWEYSCRAGTQSKWDSGNDPEKMAEVARFGKKLGDGTSRVGQYRPNQFGLCDMHGNVWEWCEDRYDASYYEASPAEDPPGPPAGLHRVIRGGSFNIAARSCRAANRNGINPAYRTYHLGFRVVRVR